MNRRFVVLRSKTLRCKECGTKSDRYKKKSKKSANGIVTHMWCEVCQRATDHREFYD